MREIKKDGTVLARLITEADCCNGLNFFSSDAEFIQVCVWKYYKKHKQLQAHIHNTVEKRADRTHEVLYVVRGCVEAAIYNLDAVCIENLEVRQGEILVLLECGHGYVIREEGTTVLEVKNGPYPGADIDRRRI